MLVIPILLEGNTSPEDAGRDIATNYEPRLKRGETSLWSLWTLLCCAILRPATGLEDFQKLVAMLMHMSDLPDVLCDGKPVVENGRVYWRDIPEFSFYFYESAMSKSQNTHIETYLTSATDVHSTKDLDQGRTPISWSEQARKFQVANAFAATYLCALDAKGPGFEWRGTITMAKDTLMEALELPVETPEQIRRAGIFVPAAAQWILVSGRQIYDYSRRKEWYEDEKVPTRWIGGTDGGPNLFEGDEGFSMERWHFWAQRFEDISKLGEKAMESVIHSATEAAKKMAMIEREHS